MSFDNSIEYIEEDNLWVVKPKGDMDIYTSEGFKEQVFNALNVRETSILIDGIDLDYIDSTGLGVLISILKRTKDSGHSIYLENIKTNIKKLFTITELDKLFIFRGEDNE